MIVEIRPQLFWVASSWDRNMEFMKCYIEWLAENDVQYTLHEKTLFDATEAVYNGCFIYIKDEAESIAFKLRWING